MGRFGKTTLPGTTLLAWRNLAHDRARFVVTLVGIAFSVVLMGVQMGLLVGFAQTASSLVDHARADLWVTAVGTTNVDIAAGLAKRRRLQALAVPGIADAEDYMVAFGFWKKPAGGNESVILVGFDPASRRGAPWQLVEGDLRDLALQGAVIIDVLYREKLGVTAVGQVVEINNRRARVVGFTDGIRTFTQSPYVFTTHANAQFFSGYDSDNTTYVLLETEPGADAESVRAAVSRRLGDVEVWHARDFSRQTQRYWLITTGAGSALLLAASLGLVVGIVIVGQTLYASTVDRLPEYATLRAMGAPNRYLYAVILKQAAISAVFGYAAGLVATLAMVAIQARSNIALVMPWWLALTLAALTAAMCAAGAVFSIRRVTRIDPTAVFAIVSLDNVTLTYGSGPTAFTALRGITLGVAAREMTLLLGPSGSGKTTLLQVMGCLLRPTTGTMRLAMSDANEPDFEISERRHVDQESLARVRLARHGFVFQHYNLFPTLRAWENVAIALDLKGRRVAMRERALALLERLGLADKANAFPAQLSGGQKQRVAIARALAGEPKVILADEPTAALDGRTGTGVAAVLHELAHEADAAVVVVSHDPRMLPYADRVLTLEDGVLTGDRRVTAAERARATETGHHSPP